jgi:hypothetical protein
MNKRATAKSLIFAAILMASMGVAGGYTLQSKSISLEVKEDLEVVTHDSGFSLFSGETLQFEVAVENHVSISYQAEMDW